MEHVKRSNAENVSYVIISDPFSGQPETYYPGDIDIKSLLDDLEGKEITSFPKDTTEAYGIKIVNSWGREKNYSIYFDKNQKYIYINDIEAEKSYLVDKPAFLSIHEDSPIYMISGFPRVLRGHQA